MSDAMTDLKQRLAEISDLQRTLGVLRWDPVSYTHLTLPTILLV